ncbi:hypothetical protein ACJX0J_014899, partial [Zea mays]
VTSNFVAFLSNTRDMSKFDEKGRMFGLPISFLVITQCLLGNDVRIITSRTIIGYNNITIVSLVGCKWARLGLFVAEIYHSQIYFFSFYHLFEQPHYNGLTSLIHGLLNCFTAFVKDDGVKLLIMKGSGRAFCAGGDVVAGVQSINNEGWKWGADFFRDQYFLNYIIARCIKPQVSLLTGIVMGGGAGVSLHGKFRVATNNTVFAMPETSLGLFPDVGASYFLARLPGFYGEYVALVGARLDGAEMLACGLATHFVPSNRMLLLEESLKKVDTSNSFVVCSTIDQFCQQPSLKQKSSLNRLEIINKCFSKRTVEEIISSLEEVASNSASKWVAQTIKYLKKASPTSLKITLRSIREGRTQTVGECLQREYRMVCHVVRGDFSRDIFEGCRAILVDKDKNPK